MPVTKTIVMPPEPPGGLALLEKIALTIGKNPDDFFGVVVLFVAGRTEADGTDTLSVDISTDAPGQPEVEHLLRKVLEGFASEQNRD